MEEISFHHVRTDEQKEQAAALIREYLGWLNERVKRDYGLEFDILPQHSTPLIIHHACALADWIRDVEKREGIKYKRHGTILGWWDHGAND